MENPEFELAQQFALYTNKHFFLTGKAGSGKTTLLKSIAKKTNKNFVVVAPTGVAAINAGGVTIHSQFNLPLTSFIPNSDSADLNFFTNRRALVEHMNFRKEKRKVIQEMELLIIDEISMVRADIIDAIDFVMRTVRRNTKPFGGVQVMLIGDMHQLPPVVRDNEWSVLKNYYNSPYFFDSVVWKQLDAAEVELKKIYRQSDERFVQLLNNIRLQQLAVADYEELKKRYQPSFQPTKGYILLSTHNHKANQVNEVELKKLEGRVSVFEAVIQGEFPEHIFPCEKFLQLKEGAQVMFTRNDAAEGNYFNGKLAVVKKILADKVTVSFNDSHQDFVLKREEWENISYTVDPANDQINKNVIGTFSQYPLRLAWAITIHKSQGLTFDKVIIDAGQSFAAGQVYVALSRCRTLEGIVLHSLISQSALHGDEKITDFSESHHSNNDLEKILQQAKVEFANQQIKRLFDFHKLRERVAEWKELLQEKEIPEKEKAMDLFEKIFGNIETIVTTASKFEPQLEKLLTDFNADSNHSVLLKERCSKAIQYFTETIFLQLISPLHQHITELAYKSKVKKYVQQVQFVQENFWVKVNQLYSANFTDEQLFTGEIKYTRDKLKVVASSVTSGKAEKGGTFKDTLELHRKGISIAEIASVRGLTIGTIKGHLARWILSGDIQLEEVVPRETILILQNFFTKSEEKTFGAAFKEFGDAYDRGDVTMVLNSMLRK